MKGTKGGISFIKLFNKVKTNISQESLRINEKEQDPEVQFSDNIAEEWKEWNLK